MPALSDLIATMKKDPVRAFVGFPIAAAARPNPGKVIEFKTGDGKIYNKIYLPIWTAIDWAWWGQGALSFAKMALDRGQSAHSRRAIEVARDKLIPVHQQMIALGPAIPPDDLIAKHYDLAVRVVIAAKNAAGGPSELEVWLGDMFTTMPITAKDSIRWLVSAGTGAVTDLVKEAAKVAASVGGGFLQGLIDGLGPFGLAIVGYFVYDHFKKRSNSDGEEA